MVCCWSVVLVCASLCVLRVASAKKCKTSFLPGEKPAYGRCYRGAFKADQSVDSFAPAGCGRESRLQVVRLNNELLSDVVAAMCEHVALATPHVEATRRWGNASAALVEAEARLRTGFMKAHLPFDKPTTHADQVALNRFTTWVLSVATESDVFEVFALRAIVIELTFWKLVSGMTWEHVLQYIAGSITSWKKAGRFDDAQRAYTSYLSGNYPARSRVAYFYDSGDYRRVSQDPEPGLRPLPTVVHSARSASAPGEGAAGSARLLPPDLRQLLPADAWDRLLRDWPALAEEAKAAAADLEEAYPDIARGMQWTKMVAYTNLYGWNETVCRYSLPKLCALLRGRLRTDSPEGRAWQRELIVEGNTEQVGVFGVGAKGWAPIHCGGDRRINIHLCLAGCRGSRAIIAGETVYYEDGGLFAFEDRADHEIINDDEHEERLNLVIGVLHPDYDPAALVRRRKQRSPGIPKVKATFRNARSAEPVHLFYHDVQSEEVVRVGAISPGAEIVRKTHPGAVFVFRAGPHPGSRLLRRIVVRTNGEHRYGPEADSGEDRAAQDEL